MKKLSLAALIGTVLILTMSVPAWAVEESPSPAPEISTVPETVEPSEAPVEPVEPSVEPTEPPVTSVYTTRSPSVLGRSTVVSYTVEPVGFPAEYISWTYSGDTIIITLEDPYFAAMDVSRDQFSQILGSYVWTLIVNGAPADGLQIDPAGKFIFPYVEDGTYYASAEGAMSMSVSVTRQVTVVEDPSPVISSLKAAMLEVFGPYEPTTQTVTEYLSDGSTVSYTEIVPGLAGLDWEWIATVGLVALVLFCILKMIGGVLKL